MGFDMAPKSYYTFMIDPDLLAALKRAKTLDPEVSEGSIIRRALREWMERNGVMKKERKRAATHKRFETGKARRRAAPSTRSRLS